MLANKIFIDIMCLCSIGAGRARFPCGWDQISLSANDIVRLGSIVIGARSAVESNAWITSISDRLGTKVSRLYSDAMGLWDMVPGFVKLP